jgi:ubiquinone biosynthesis protein
MQKVKRKKDSVKKKRIKSEKFLKSLNTESYEWIKPLAKKIRLNADVIAKFISFVFAEIALLPFENQKNALSRFNLTKNVAKILFPKSDAILTQFEKSLYSLQENLTQVSSDILKDTEVTHELICPIIEVAASTIEENPALIALFGQPHILEVAFGPLGEKIVGLIKIIPALSTHAAEKFPDLKEMLFRALFQLKKDERNKLYKLAENILGEVYREKVFPHLKKTLSADPRGKVLAPILLGAIESIPGESCINAVLAIACTPHHELSNGRIIAIAIQEMGGLYIKISQVIAELCPPSLARQLRTTQDDAGGLFPSIEKSWEYLLEVLSKREFSHWKKYFTLPEKPIRHFASASVGALYNFELNEKGKEKFGVSHVLVKLQRPNLEELFQSQCDDILNLIEQAHEAILEDSTLTSAMSSELIGLAAALKRAVLNYNNQSQKELDFNEEEKNAEKVRHALGNNSSVKIPKFFETSKEVVFMECVSGTKVTKIVQTKYLERREIADNISKTYIDLLFTKGVVWADPHPGNILYDDEKDQVSMVDLNPCYVWDAKTRQEFKHLIYRLLLRDAQGIYKTLYYLVDNKESLHSNEIVDALHDFLNYKMNGTNLTRFVGEFIKILNENQIDLKIEVQAALRGLSQIALTTASISCRNNFGKILREQFSLKELLGTVWDVGIIRVIKIIFSMLFELTRQMPDQDIGPVLDERDLLAISNRTKELALANVCKVKLSRVSPEDHPNLKISQDGQVLLITSDLHIEVLDKVKPATVQYKIEIPSKSWLKDRQEFVKLSSIARSFCIIECLEQLRRNSLDEYWKIVESWNKPVHLRTAQESYLIGEAKIAASDLYSIRFKNIWKASTSDFYLSSAFAWKSLVLVESWKETSKQNYFISQKKKLKEIPFANIAYSGFFRLKFLFLEALLWFMRRHINNLKFSMHLLPMSTQELEDLVLLGLSRKMPMSKAEGLR